MKRHNTYPLIITSLFLTIITLATFWRVQNHHFINLDDNVYITENRHVNEGLKTKNISWAFTTFYHGNWSPITLLSHMIDCQVYGFNPAGHHFNNLLFHIANTLLLFLFLQRTTRLLWQSAFVAALFALHPLHVEPVAWISSRKDVLSTFFFMLTLFTYSRYAENPGVIRYLIVLLFFIMGLLSKAMLVTLPFILLLMDYWPLGRIRFKQSEINGCQAMNKKYRKAFPQQLIKEKYPFFILSLVMGIIAFLAQQKLGALPDLEALPLKFRMANGVLSYGTYIFKMIYPIKLSIFYPYPGMRPLWLITGVVVFLIITTGVAFKMAGKYPYFITGWLWYLVTLLPVIGFVQIGSHVMADRYTYIPLTGLFIVITYGISSFISRGRYHGFFLIPAGVFLLVFLISVTDAYLRKWSNSTSLFQHALSVTKNNYLALNNLGTTLYLQGKEEEAISYYREAIRINPFYAEAHYNLGVVLARQGHLEEAEAHYKETLRINPNHERANNNLGLLYDKKGMLSKAIQYYNEALRIRPDDEVAHTNIGVVFAKQGDFKNAIKHHAEAIRIKPDFPLAHKNMAIALIQLERHQEAK